MSKKGKTYLFSVLAILFLIVSIQSVYNLSLIYRDQKIDIEKMNFSNISEIDYNVNIIENEFIDLETIPFGNTYITELVDSIDLTFQYEFLADKILDLQTEYEVKATILGYYNQNPDGANNPLIWEKEFILKEKQTLSAHGKHIDLKEDLHILLDEYNLEAMLFKETLEIPTIVYVKFEMPVTVTGESKEYNFVESNIVDAQIKLTEKVFYIEAEKSKSEKEYITPTNPTIKQGNSRSLIIYISLFILSTIMIIISIKRIPFFYHDFCYEDYIDSLKFDYDEIIVETENMIDIRKYSSVLISSFKEMLNLSQNLESPVILFERKKFSLFYIVSGKIIYIYFVKNDKKTIQQIMKSN